MKVRALVAVATGLLALTFFADAQTSTSATTNASASVQVPRLIRFSGVAKDESSKPLSGVLGITFAIYKDEQGGSPLWLETQNVQADTAGHYTALLGATKPDGVPFGLFTSGEAQWLEVRGRGQAEQPRILLVSVPYAIKGARGRNSVGPNYLGFRTPQSGQPTVTSCEQSSNQPELASIRSTDQDIRPG